MSTHISKRSRLRNRTPGKTENIQMRKREVAMLEGALDEYDQKGSTQ
ncbi:hypothetical protein JG536_06355 [Burkholderia ambifaria]|nr:hypothetical protein [Burkholderia ambifaria]QQJ98271.1 hypothetical protein JG536_06355 [Burkholderia ambifaria]